MGKWEDGEMGRWGNGEMGEDYLTIYSPYFPTSLFSVPSSR